MAAARPRLVALTALTALSMIATLACDDDTPEEAKPAKSAIPTLKPKSGSSGSARPQGSAAAKKKNDQPSEHTGVLDEKRFQALHELKDAAAPKPKGEEVKLKSSTAYLSLPENAKPPLPALVVIHEWWGLNEHIKHYTDRLAADGYAAIAVDLYDGKVATESEEAMKLMKAVDAEASKKKLHEAFEYLGSNERIKAFRRGSIGWCFGGKWSLNLAMAEPKLSAAVVYYGHVPTTAEALKPLGKTPLLAHFGNEDEGIPPKTVDAFQEALKKNGANYRIERYDAKHAFANPSSARYEHDSAALAWKQTRIFLAKHLKR